MAGPLSPEKIKAMDAALSPDRIAEMDKALLPPSQGPLAPAQGQGMDWMSLLKALTPDMKIPPPSVGLPMAIPGGGLLGAGARIGAAGLGGAMETKTPGGAVGPLARTAAIEGIAPAIGNLLKILPGLKNLLPHGPLVTHTEKTSSHVPWIGQTLKDAADTPVVTGPYNVIEKSVVEGAGRAYAPNLPAWMRQLLNYPFGMGLGAAEARGQRPDEP